MQDMVSSVPSAWLKMEQGLRTFSAMVSLMVVLAVVLAVLSVSLFVLAGYLDLSWIVAAVLAVGLVGLRRFCVGAMERLRQLSELV